MTEQYKKQLSKKKEFFLRRVDSHGRPMEDNAYFKKFDRSGQNGCFKCLLLIHESLSMCPRCNGTFITLMPDEATAGKCVRSMGIAASTLLKTLVIQDLSQPNETVSGNESPLFHPSESLALLPSSVKVSQRVSSSRCAKRRHSVLASEEASDDEDDRMEKEAADEIAEQDAACRLANRARSMCLSERLSIFLDCFNVEYSRTSDSIYFKQCDVSGEDGSEQDEHFVEINGCEFSVTHNLPQFISQLCIYLQIVNSTFIETFVNRVEQSPKQIDDFRRQCHENRYRDVYLMFVQRYVC